MRAAVLRGGDIVVRDDVAIPQPETGQVLVDVKACGICGSDLHFAKHGATMLALGEEMRAAAGGAAAIGSGGGVDLGRDVFMGHEFSAEVLELGPNTTGPAPGTIVTSIPILLSSAGVKDLVYTNDLPAGYSEKMVLSAPMLVEVPNGLDPKYAALTEPMAVGLHAVNRSGITTSDGALVLGCGPVGLAVIAAMSLRGIEPIVASDFSPARRELAKVMGAHEVVDPSTENAFDGWSRAGKNKPVVVFDAIGVRGIIDDVFLRAPHRARLVVVGVCMERDTITPFYGISRELSVQFVLGYDPMEFGQSLRSIAEGEYDVKPLITGEVGLDGVPQAFDDLGNPEKHCKILVVP
jgi:threonine dehydrogenase-like Zn-dependent dehydrogenase